MIYTIENSRKWIDSTWKKLETKLSRTAQTARNKLPDKSINGVYNDVSDIPYAWTNGFWPGMMWLMYADTKDEEYRITAETGEELFASSLETFEHMYHDLGFMWEISGGANYRLTGSEKGKNRALLAASHLAGRFNLRGNYIRAWNGFWVEETKSRDNVNIGWSIIDCMMNLPILYWASDELKDDRYRYIAMAHADMAMEQHVRADGSVIHIVDHDKETGEKIEFSANGYGQGYDNFNSSWSRGQAWALYGFILSYIHTGKQEYLDTAKRVGHYFISNMRGDYLPLADFRAPKEPVIYDSSAGACAACGLIEIANNVPEFESEIYMDAAIRILKAMEENWCDWSENEDAVLLMGSGSWNLENYHGNYIFGDYYFVEALYKLRGNKILFW